MATVSFSSSDAGSFELPLRQFDASQYMAMTSAGVFDVEHRVELIGGYIVDMSPANPDHNYVIMRLNEIFMPLAGQFKLWIQGTLRVNQDNVYDPDFMLLRPRVQSYKVALPTPADVALLIEVAGSSKHRDEKAKLPEYAKEKIADYWIADLERETVVVRRQPHGDTFGDSKIYGRDSVVSPLAAQHFKVKVNEIFD